MGYREAILAGLRKRDERRRDADYTERQSARMKSGKLQSRKRPIRPRAVCVNCGSDPALGCSDCPAERFA